MQERLQAIETEYRGHKYRSRLEARWAVFFDNAKIPYVYEPEGFRMSDGTCYLPDFYLPDSKTFVEIKGVMKDQDMRKIQSFMKEAKTDFLIGYDDIKFQACDNWEIDQWSEEELTILAPEDPKRQGYTLASKGESSLVRCIRCGKKYFMGWSASFRCKCCGAHEGDGHFVALLDGDGDSTWYARAGTDNSSEMKAREKAMKARFEYGEKP